MVKKLLHTRYRVKDLEKTVSFYRDVLGLQEVRRHTSGRGSQLVFFKAPQSEEEIEICKFDESGPVVVGPDLTHLAFGVDDLDRFARESRRRTEWMMEFALERGWRINSPRDVNERGGSVMIDVDDGPAMVDRLAHRNVFVDCRPGVGLRISPHFFNTDEEVAEAMTILSRLIGPTGPSGLI